ncbi:MULTISPECIES: type I-E CRISPR-associated protein Cas6/Cse3/CasE [Pseudoalteromonas]|uniref:Type I-E CRISPR-associated protein Cas6/Cse3/CasE n=1 Tax=Pseudoalteromonas amylolytica TaxID=1859457 RepID=A0A1S1MTL6_9GAMM|nr:MULTISPECIES: type I-E CRISPR-associated protein Cas6/Cse3/CasE [Pseudoalteromonas]OHU85064.1 type I-E CRISPR-associated protein Cas6/Cse3/CasE [Pseudoalteromonas sp. JW3]OHU89984.1 type I-E CRISPR-associated protein Cas6/Cse3/CasE [Pseudoalteromonas amylolytica]
MSDNIWYESRLYFDPEQEGEDLGFLHPDDLYKQHQWVWRCFAESELTQADFMFRVDMALPVPTVFIRSKRQLKEAIQSWKVTTQIKENQFETQGLVQFSLRANPTVDITPKGEKTRRHDVLMHAKKQAQHANSNVNEAVDVAAKAWLDKKLQKGGLEPLMQCIEFSNYKQHKVAKKEGAKSIQLSTLDYFGVAKVADVEKLRQVLQTGIGRSKAFGCGLLLVKPL